MSGHSLALLEALSSWALMWVDRRSSGERHTSVGSEESSCESSMVWRRLLLLLLLLMVGEEKMVPPYLLPHIYTISQDHLPSCQRIVNIQLHLIHAAVGPPSTPIHRYLACIEPTGCCGDNGTLRFELRLPSTADAMPPKRRRRRLARTLDIDPGAINTFVAASPPIVAGPGCTC